MTFTQERRSYRWRPLALMLALILGPIQPPVAAFVGSGAIGPVEYRVMAPDWICRGEVVSILIVVSSTDPAGTEGAELVATLKPPDAGFEAPAQTTLERRVKLSPGDLERFAFTGWKAQVGAALGRYTFQLRLESPRGEGPVELKIPVETIRGAAVPEGIWSILVPVAISLLALPAFALLLLRCGRPGAWRQAVSPEIPVPDNPWWKGARAR